MKTKSIFSYALGIIMIVLFGTLAGCEKPSSGRGAIEGTVYQATTGEPIQGVHVKYANINLVTDINGHYAMDTIPEGLQGFTFYSPGYKTQVSQVMIPRDGKIVNDITLEVISVGWAVGAPELSYGSIFYTSDGGNNWKRQGTINTIPDAILRGVCAVDTNTCWVVGDTTKAGNCTILLSSDAGESWTSQLNTLSDGRSLNFSGIAAVDKDTAWVVARDFGIVLKTKNKGNGWEVCLDTDAVDGFESVTTPDGVHMWCSGRSVSDGKVVWYSADGGKNWEEQTVIGAESTSDAIYDIKAVTSSMVYAVGSSGVGVVRTQDGGASWSAVHGSEADLRGVCVIGEKVWIVGDAGNVWFSMDGFATPGISGVIPSSNHSDSFSSVSMIGDATSGAATIFNPDTSIEGGVLFTSDGGRNWMMATVPYKQDMYCVSFAGVTH